jgi:hypothetical protein
VSYEEKPEFQALGELQSVLKNVTDELSAWRRRAHRAEATLGEGHDAVAQRERVLELEAEHRDMQERLEAARLRVEELLKRLQFLEEQMAVEDQAR